MAVAGEGAEMEVVVEAAVVKSFASVDLCSYPFNHYELNDIRYKAAFDRMAVELYKQRPRPTLCFLSLTR